MVTAGSTARQRIFHRPTESIVGDAIPFHWPGCSHAFCFRAPLSPRLDAPGALSCETVSGDEPFMPGGPLRACGRLHVLTEGNMEAACASDEVPLVCRMYVPAANHRGLFVSERRAACAGQDGGA